MKSLLRLAQVLLDDLSSTCMVKTTRDHETIARRFEHEGDSFLTITLPTFAKDFERSLSMGRVASDGFRSFSRSAGLPRFLGGFLQHVFDRSTGVLLETPCVACISSLRQFTMAFGKLRELCHPDRVQTAFDAYVSCEQDVRLHSSRLDDPTRAAFRDRAKALYSGIYSQVADEIDDFAIVPKHGPGAVQEGIHGNEKYNSRTWHERLQPYFPLDRYLFPNPIHWAREQDNLVLLPADAEPPLRVISVPKTMKTPRIIAIEPTCMQYVQQGLMASLVPKLERVFGGRIGFTDQSRNQRLAREGSVTGEISTLDLSEASDRVSMIVVQDLLSCNRTVLGAVMACRSRTADVPGHGIIPLAKFASMGSALCFPIEAMVFFTIVSLAITSVDKSTISSRSYSRAMEKVAVYGDDIIVPARYTMAVRGLLATYGLQVNTAKSFSEGNFRESCGGDYFSGVDVTPVRVRTRLPQNRKDTEQLMSTVALRNRCWDYGFHRTTQLLDRALDEIIYVPFAPVDTAGLVRWTTAPVKGKVDTDNQRLVYRGLVARAPLPRHPLADSGALMKFFLHKQASSLPMAVDSLERSGRPLSVSIKTGWLAAR